MSGRIVGASLRQHRGEATRPLRSAAGSWQRRNGWLLELHDERGTVGRGEASPLPGYSRESSGAVGAALERWSSALPRALDLGDAPLGEVAQMSAEIPARAPSARFAVESALLDLWGRRCGSPVWRYLEPLTDTPRSALTCLLSSEAREREQQAREGLARGVGSFKIKVGARDAGSEREELARMREVLGRHAVLRLDANGALAEAEIEERLQAYTPCAPQFLEEPLPGAALRALGHGPVPLALDESLDLADWASWEPWFTGGPGGFLVLKPARLGGLVACRRLAARAAELRVPVVVSHLFDGPVALAAAGALALAVATPGVPCGLDRHAGLGAWPPLAIAGLGAAELRPTETPGLGLQEGAL